MAWLESAAFTAFVMEIISASSLPLGTLTSAVWRPGDRTVAFLMAFGGGALLAALTLDLVGSALALGHFPALALGCVVGGLLFIGLNHVVNDYGGFLRKFSTTVYHLRRQSIIRVRGILGNLGRMSIFHGLPDRDLNRLARAIHTREYDAGEILYRRHDPSEALYIIADGTVELLDPQRDMQPFETLGRNDAFARMAFCTGAPNATVARAITDTRVWVLPRHRLEDLVADSPEINRVLRGWLRDVEVLTYLQERHGLDAEAARAWMELAEHSLLTRGVIPPAVPVERREKAFLNQLDRIERFHLFSRLPPEEATLLASCLIYKRHHRGEPFFLKGDVADRMYVIDEGEVSLIEHADSARRPILLSGRDAFGGMAFITGARHAASAIPAEDTGVWVLRRRDLKDLMRRAPELERRVRDFLQREPVSTYLECRQNFNADKTSRWVQKAVRNIDSGELIPAARQATARINLQHGAPMAIWLGILLDGIPESLVIGASLVHSSISYSLLAGLFLSNYPEAFSSSIGMRQQGMSFRRALLMWTSIMLITGVGAAVGNLFFLNMGDAPFALLEGVAAGAMLTMIAQTMLPEAYFRGGSIIGFATLLGFLAAIYFKTLE